ncbi:hypothetical protein IGJ16_002567 [Enterococcus pernyi]
MLNIEKIGEACKNNLVYKKIDIYWSIEPTKLFLEGEHYQSKA